MADLPVVGGSYNTWGTELNEYLRSIFIHVGDYGASGDGSDETTEIQAAIDAAPAGGGTVFFPQGEYVFSSLSLASKSFITLLGGGGIADTTLRFNSTTGNVFNLTGARFIRFSNLNIRPTTEKTSGAVFNLDNCDDSIFEHLRISSPLIAFIIDNGSSDLKFEHIRILDQNSSWNISYGVDIRNTSGQCSSITMRDVNVITASESPGSFLHVNDVDTLDVDNCGCQKTAAGYMTGFHVLGGTYISLRNCRAECGTAGQTGYLIGGGTHISLLDCHASVNLYGMRITAGDGVKIIGGDSYYNQREGIQITGGTDILVSGVQVLDNNVAAGDFDGIQVAANVSDFQIIGNNIGSIRGTPVPVSYGIRVLSGTSNNYIIAGNKITNYNNGALLDGGYGRTTETEYNVKMFGATGDGTTDDTAAIQAAIDAANAAGGGTVFFPKGTYATGAILLYDNITLHFEPGCILEADTSGVSASQGIIGFADKTKVRIIGNQVVLRYTGTLTDSVIRYGISVRGGTDIVIDGIRVEYSTGDGIFVSTGSTSQPDCVVVKNCVAYECRRNGFTVGSGKNVILENCRGERTGQHATMGGTNPQAGFDIEFELSGAVGDNVVLRNCVGDGNVNQSFIIGAGAWDTAGLERIGITLDACDSRSDRGIAVANLDDTTAGDVVGTITIRDCRIYDSVVNALQVTEWSSAGPPVIIENLSVWDCNTSNAGGFQYSNAVAVYRDSGSGNTYQIGNVIIRGVRAYDSRASEQMRRVVYVHDLTNSSDATYIGKVYAEDIFAHWEDATPPSSKYDGFFRVKNTQEPEPQVLDDTGTPSVQGGESFVTGGTTTITDFDDGVEGQIITIIAEHSVTITDGTHIFLADSTNWAMASGDTLTLIQKSDTYWYELSRTDTYSGTYWSELTLDVNGAITPTSTCHRVDTYADAATDDLEDINNATAGKMLTLAPASTSRVVTVKDNIGNIKLNGDFAMTGSFDMLTLIADGTNWSEVSRSSNG